MHNNVEPYSLSARIRFSPLGVHGYGGVSRQDTYVCSARGFLLCRCVYCVCERCAFAPMPTNALALTDLPQDGRSKECTIPNCSDVTCRISLGGL